MSEQALRDEIKHRLKVEIFGGEWRPENPLDDMGGAMEILARGRADTDTLRFYGGVIEGLRRAADIVDEAFAAVMTLNEGRPT